ncbi:type II secretion system minor pseudopilin GspI [Sphingopyxis granuli]|uniref:Type II secretion system protein I n=1 Tax=Sphingopyxis granuli TaxID=267128 RepID=A0AA86GJZ7_9SPHN|nr:type II secretion system minor pseudopilin GspI [Sphingopyxis granuli]AMG73606.1 General secretion pathway protein I [Sphingopyxis granuli]
MTNRRNRSPAKAGVHDIERGSPPLGAAASAGARTRADDRGFTLLEMLVALSIISIAALTLVRLDAYAVRSAGDLDERTVAGIVAQNRAVEIWTDPVPPTIGASAVGVANAGRNWRIEQRVARTADDSLLRIDLIVRPESGRGQAALTIVRSSR